MAASKGYTGNLTGFPALFFLENLHDGRGTKTYFERMWSLESRYSYLLAHIPERFNKNQKTQDDYKTRIFPEMEKMTELVDQMFDRYDPTYEELMTCNPEEKAFIKILRLVKEQIDVVAGMTGIIDGIAAGDEEMLV